MLIVPIGTDNPLRRPPTMNTLLIGANVIIFLAPFVMAMLGIGSVEALRIRIEAFKLHSESPRLYEFISYAFLHADLLHLIGNMVFLYIFGNNVNEKLGHAGYLLFYLAGGVFSGIGHAMLHASPVLGASGAVASVTGAYMVLFPKTAIHVLYWFFFIGTIWVPAYYFILFKLIIWDNFFAKMGAGQANIAYDAHLAGYAFGIIVPLVMLWMKVLPHSQFDLWAVLQRWRRRRQYDNLVNEGFDPFTGKKVAPKRPAAKTPPPNPHAEEIINRRMAINAALAEQDLTQASHLYEQLLQLDEKQVLPQQSQLDLANHFMQTGQYPAAARAYTLFLNHYPHYPFTEQVELMLGLLLSRYLDRPKDAIPHLDNALKRLTQTTQRTLCQQELQRLKAELPE